MHSVHTLPFTFVYRTDYKYISALFKLSESAEISAVRYTHLKEFVKSPEPIYKLHMGFKRIMQTSRGSEGKCLKLQWIIYRVKRRVTRAVRPTKRNDLSEADGEPEGKIVFQLEKESEHETFKIRKHAEFKH